MFEAVNAIDRRYESYLKLSSGDRSASQEGTAAAAAHDGLMACAVPAPQRLIPRGNTNWQNRRREGHQVDSR